MMRTSQLDKTFSLNTCLMGFESDALDAELLIFIFLGPCNKKLKSREEIHCKNHFSLLWKDFHLLKMTMVEKSTSQAN